MKYILILILIAQSYGVVCQGFVVTDPILVAENLGFNHPQIELDQYDDPLVIWTSGNNNLYLSKFDGIGDFTTPIQLNPVGLDIQSYNWSGPDLFVENENVFVIFRSLGYDTGHIYLVKSVDNGNTFGDTIRVDNLASGFGQYPDIAVYQDTIWVTFMDHENGGIDPQYVVTRSVDGGSSFESIVPTGVILGDEACDCCQPEIIVNDEHVLVFFRNNDNNIRDVKGIISYDRGVTFSDWISVDDHQWNINACPSTGPDARFFKGDTSITVYKTEVGSEPRLYLNMYDLNADQSVGQVQISDANSLNSSINYPQVAVRNNTIGVVWEAYAENGLDVFINASSTGVNGLSPSNAFNLTQVNGSQLRPDLAMSSNAFHVVYTDYIDQTIKYQSLNYLADIQDVEDDNFEINIYPNPVKDIINIELESDIEHCELLITKVNGQVLYQNELEEYNEASSFKIDIRNWDSGVYFIQVKTSNGQSIVRRIII